MLDLHHFSGYINHARLKRIHRIDFLGALFQVSLNFNFFLLMFVVHFRVDFLALRLQLRKVNFLLLRLDFQVLLLYVAIRDDDDQQ